MNRICHICRKSIKGRGCYSFTYLNDRVDLCGHHARKAWNFIMKQKRGIVE